MAERFYTPVTPSVPGHSGGTYRSSPATAGPWSPGLQHGGPPSALSVLCAQRDVMAETGRTDLVAQRIAVDFLAPVPVGEIEVSTTIVRAARSAVLAQVIISAAGRECLHSRVWFVRELDTDSVRGRVWAPLPLPDAPNSAHHAGLDFGYGQAMEWRFLHGELHRPGPAAVWVRPILELLDDEPLPGLARAALIADSSNGVSAELDWSRWSFVNIDLDVHLARPLAGDWLLLQAMTQLGGRGCGLARATLSDSEGDVGSSLQTLLLTPLPG